MFKKILMTLAAVLMLANFAMAGGKTITFAVDATWPPMEYVNADKEIVGFSIDMLNAVAREAGFTPVYKNTAWDGIFAGLANGAYDAVDASVTINEKRKKAMDFSDAYFIARQAIVTKIDSPLKSEADLKGKTVGSQMGTTGFIAMSKADGVISKGYDEVGLAIADLANGRLDAVVCDDPVAAGFALQNEAYKGTLKIAFNLTTTEEEHLGWAVKKGNTEVLDLLNKGLRAIKASGEYDTIRAKWFGN